MLPVVSTTPTQYALAVCFLVLGPVFGVMGALLQWRREENVAFGAIVVVGASWLAWFVSCGVALVLFPGYPVSGAPPEPIAMAFTVPGAAAGILVLQWLATRRPPTRGDAKRFAAAGWLAVVVGVLLSVGLVEGHARLTTSAARRALPASAVIVSEEAYADAFVGDHRYTLSARMSPAEFRDWMRRLGLRELPGRALDYEREGSSMFDCGAEGWYRNGVGHYVSWCA